MKALKYIGLGGLLVLLTIGCSDFLKEYSQDTYYVALKEKNHFKIWRIQYSFIILHSEIENERSVLILK